MVIELVWPETVGRTDGTDGRRGGGESDSSLNCGNDSVMHSAAATERERGARNFAGCCERKGWRAALLLL